VVHVEIQNVLCEISGSHVGEYEAESSGMYRRVVSKYTDVSEVRTASIIMVIYRPDDGGSTHL